jgi:hypothetical protein
MSVILVALGLLLLALPHAMPGAHLDRDTRWSVAGTGLGLRLIEVAAALAAVPTLLRALGVHSMADACHRLASPIPPGSLGGDLLTALAIGMLAHTAWVRIRVRRGREVTRIETTLGVHQAYDRHPNTHLVILPTDRWLAYSVPGTPNQIVVSQGVTERLSPAELDALLEHETAHLRLGHHKALRLLAEIDGLTIGRARHLTDRVRLMLERTADQIASSTCGAPAVQGALAVGAGQNPNTTVAVRHDALSRANGPSQPWLPFAVGAAGLAAAAVFVTGTLVADHGVWGVVGLCGI